MTDIIEEKAITEVASLYVGDKEVESVNGETVIYKDGLEDTFTESELKYMITIKPNDLSAQRDQLIKAITPELMALIEAYNIKQIDL
jgi:hypothetical protein